MRGGQNNSNNTSIKNEATGTPLWMAPEVLISFDWFYVFLF